MMNANPLSREPAHDRRAFLKTTALFAAATALPGCRSVDPEAHSEPIIDIHQHLGYSGRSDEEFLAHQQTMGASLTILLPAGRPVRTASTHDGSANGLQAQCLGNEACYAFARAHPKQFRFAANEVPDLPEARQEIEKYLKRGGVVIAEQKFGVECDSPAMQDIYRLAADYRVPVLMHWQHGRYSYGLERFHTMLERFPRTIFIGHAQTWWANIDLHHNDQTVLYPKGKVTPGGLTDRYLGDYQNLYGDLSAGSGLNALTRDEDHARHFLARHQNQLLYGSDCSDRVGTGAACSGWQMIEAVRRLAPDKAAERKMLYGNARRVFRL